MSMQFDATYYMDVRPDVLTAFVNSGAEAGTGLTWPAFAQQHYNNHGWKEGYNPNPIFNTNEYLTANEDVLNAGVNPFEHYLTHGVNEGRAPNASFPKFADFDADAYLAANSDLGEAGIETAEEAYAHFVMHGQFENRPGAPVVDTNPGDIFTLTTGVDAGADFTGTAGNDTFRAFDMDGPTGAAGATLQSWDILDGGAGTDTLNISTGAIADNAAPVIRNIEIINNAHAGAVLNLGSVTGVEQVWSDFSETTDAAPGRYEYSNASLNTTFGATGNDANDGAVHITFAGSVAGDTTVNLALEGNVEGSFTGFYFDDGGIENAVITVADGNDGFVSAAGVENITVSGDGDFGFLTFGDDALEVLDARGVDGDVTVRASIDTAGGSVADDAVITTGAGNDAINLSATTGDITIDGGAGNDTIIAGEGNDTIIAGAGKNDLTGGEGEDTFVLTVQGTTFGNLDVIRDFNFDGEQDTLVFGDVEMTEDNTVEIGGAASYNDLRELAQGSFDEDVLFVAGTFEGATYVFYNADGEGDADAAVQLIGTVDLFLDAPVA